MPCRIGMPDESPWAARRCRHRRSRERARAPRARARRPARPRLPPPPSPTIHTAVRPGPVRPALRPAADLRGSDRAGQDRAAGARRAPAASWTPRTTSPRGRLRPHPRTRARTPTTRTTRRACRSSASSSTTTLTLDATSPLGMPTTPESTSQPPHARVRSGLGLRVRAVRRPDPVRGRPCGSKSRPPRRVRGRAAPGGRHGADRRLPQRRERRVNGIHAAFIAAHNRLITSGAADHVQGRPPPLTWHWQWVVLNEFLPATLGTQLPTALSRGDQRLFPQLPSVRCGRVPEHRLPLRAQPVRPSYRMNFAGGPDGGQRFAFVFDASRVAAADPSDMQGGIAGAGGASSWPTFFASAATARSGCGRTRRSTPSSRRRCSTCRPRRSAARRTCSPSRSATCCAT